MNTKERLIDILRSECEYHMKENGVLITVLYEKQADAILDFICSWHIGSISFGEWIDDKMYNNLLSRVRDSRNTLLFNKWIIDWALDSTIPKGTGEIKYVSTIELFKIYLSSESAKIDHTNSLRLKWINLTEDMGRLLSGQRGVSIDKLNKAMALVQQFIDTIPQSMPSARTEWISCSKHPSVEKTYHMCWIDKDDPFISRFTKKYGWEALTPQNEHLAQYLL